MKKDKAWLKKEVCELYPSFYRTYVLPKKDDLAKTEIINNVFALINQLDEQEITFEQAHDKLREESILSEKSFDYYWNCINDNVEIDEPGNILVPKQDKPVIPKFVAKHIEASKKIGDRLNVALSKSPETGMVKKMNVTISEANNIYARAWLDGYEVEKEKKYYVLNSHGKTILVKLFGKQIAPSQGRCVNDLGRRNSDYQFTEQEIKDYDKRYWVFAKEVTE